MKKVIIVALLLQACSYAKPLNIKGFDSDAFKGDRGGCEDKRKLQLDFLKTNRDGILGISENEIIKVFGRYDYEMLDRKNEKYFVYFFEKGPHCQSMQNKTQAECMVLHFNSIALVKEVIFQKGGIAD